MRSLKLAGVYALLALMFAAGVPNANADTKEWKLHIIWSETRPEAKQYMRFAELANEKANGEFKITVYPGASLGIKDQDMLRILPPGSAVQIAGIYPGYMSRDAANAVNALPPAVIATPAGVEALLPELSKVYDAMYAKWGVKLLAYIGHPVRDTFIFCKTPINKLDDLKSKKTRVWEKFYADVFDEIGVPAQVVGQRELYVAAQTGVIDCAVSAITAKDISLQEVLPHFAYIAPYTLQPLQLVVSQKSFDTLSDKGKAALTEAAAIVEKESMENFVKGVLEGKLAAELVAQGAKKIDAFSDADQKRFTDAARTVWKKSGAAKTDEGKIIYKAVMGETN